MEHSLLVVDDEVDNVDALERLFRKKYKVFKATSGPKALEILDQNPATVIISDQRMPEMTGVEFLEKSIGMNPDAVRILLTGYTDVESVIDAINAGQIYRYVTKPWDPNDLTSAVDQAIERYELREALKQKNIELRKALDELKTLDEAKSNFMFLVNHELKTPLTSILSFLELFKETQLSEEQSLYLNRIEKSSFRLKRMVDDVLQLVSAETGQIRLSPKTLKLKELLEPFPADVTALIEKKNITVKQNLRAAQVFADEQTLKTVLHRLLHNAVKFSDEKGKVEVKSDSHNNRTLIEISNPGAPIDEKTLEKILKPFTLDENWMNHSQGLGLGLSICQAVLKLHGSQLQIQNRKNRIIVSFLLPEKEALLKKITASELKAH